MKPTKSSDQVLQNTNRPAEFSPTGLRALQKLDFLSNLFLGTYIMCVFHECLLGYVVIPVTAEGIRCESARKTEKTSPVLNPLVANKPIGTT